MDCLFWLCLELSVLYAMSDTTAAGSKLPANCEEVFVYGSKTNGIYTMKGGYDVYCQFNYDGTGYTFPSRAALNNPHFTLSDHYTANELSHVIVRVIRSDNINIQDDNIIGQITEEKHRLLAVFLNEHTNYQGPIGRNAARYIYVGLIPDAEASQRNRKQGWSANGYDYTFTNCDANGNSYFTFYNTLNMAQNAAFRTDYALGNAWRGRFWNHLTSYVIPSEDFIFAMEYHFGGCGVREISLDWNQKRTNPVNSKGVAIGLPFRMIDNCIGIACPEGKVCLDLFNSYVCTELDDSHGCVDDVTETANNYTTLGAIIGVLVVLVVALLATVIVLCVILARRKGKQCTRKRPEVVNSIGANPASDNSARHYEELTYSKETKSSCGYDNAIYSAQG